MAADFYGVSCWLEKMISCWPASLLGWPSNLAQSRNIIFWENLNWNIIYGVSHSSLFGIKISVSIITTFTVSACVRVTYLAS